MKYYTIKINNIVGDYVYYNINIDEKIIFENLKDFNRIVFNKKGLLIRLSQLNNYQTDIKELIKSGLLDEYTLKQHLKYAKE